MSEGGKSKGKTTIYEESPEPAAPSGEKLLEGRDFYFDPEAGFCVMTEEYLRRRGFCCGNGCRHCPYGSPATPDQD